MHCWVLRWRGVDRSTVPRGTCSLQDLNAIEADLLPWLLQSKYLHFAKGVNLGLYDLSFFFGVEVIIRGWRGFTIVRDVKCEDTLVRSFKEVH